MHSGERNQKYMELKKREQVMDGMYWLTIAGYTHTHIYIYTCVCVYTLTTKQNKFGHNTNKNNLILDVSGISASSGNNDQMT